MKKVIVANYRYFVSGGPEVYMLKFMDKCDSIGYEPIPFSVKYDNNLETEYDKYFISSRSKGNSVYYDQIKKNPKSIYKTLQGAFYNRETVKNVNKLINEEQPKVLYALQVINTISPSIFKAAKKRGLKVIHRISDFNLICPKSDLLYGENVCEDCLTNGLNSGYKKRCFHGSRIASYIRYKSMCYHRKKHLYDFVDYFVTPTEFTRQKLIAGGFDPKKIIKIPTFIDSTNIMPNYNHNNYVLFLGRLVPEKGAKYAIEAMKYLKDQNIVLKITGNLSDKDSEIKRIIDENDIGQHIEFVGFKKGLELKNLISNAMCILCPAIWYENMPNTVLEAFAYGKPVIASDFGCFPELIDNDIDGMLFSPKNSFELSEKIRILFKNDDIRIKMGKNGRNKVETIFSPEQHFNELKKLFDC